MKKTSSQIWLYRLFNSSYFDTWMAVSYLHRYPSIGIQSYICSKLELRDDLSGCIPQLLHIMFYTSDSTISYPIYHLIASKSKKNSSFAMEVYFHLNSYISTLCDSKALFCRSLMANIIHILDYNGNKLPRNTAHKSYINHRTLIINSCKSTNLMLEGVFLYFLKAISWPISDSSMGKIKSYENLFRMDATKIHKITTKNKNISFLIELVNISLRLKALPKNIKQKGLEIELEHLSVRMGDNVHLPFRREKFIVNLCAAHSLVLDSATNTPYILLLELASVKPKFRKEISPEIETAMMLLNQISPTASAGSDTKNLYESIVSKLTRLSLRRPHKNKNLNWPELKENIRKASNMSHLNGYEIVSVIVKGDKDFKQEFVAYQLLTEIKKIFIEDQLPIWIKNYRIYYVDKNAGLVETVTNAESIHMIKKKNAMKKGFSLKKYYLGRFPDFDEAKQNFMISLVGYSLVTYILQLKDRHNGNILIDEKGHVVHVDFGFILGGHPGFYNVEMAPFKFSYEYNELLGSHIDTFKEMFLNGFISLRKNSDRLCRVLEMLNNNSEIRCINKRSVMQFRERFKLELTNSEIKEFVKTIVNIGINNKSSGVYDQFQYYSNGYL